jgi:hypothetical protein
MSKYFIVNPYAVSIDKELKNKNQKEREDVGKKITKERIGANKEVLSQECDLKNISGSVVVKIDLQHKNWHTFSDGTTIRRERQFNEFNRRITEPVNAIVVSADDIPAGAEILIHPNCIHDTHRIFNYKPLSGKEEGSDVKYYSIKEDECFLWLDEHGVWQPLAPYATALRVYKPYSGLIVGMPPEKVKDVLYVTSGELEGKVVKTLTHSDYCVIFQGLAGKEDTRIRFRPFGDPKTKREEEAIAILWDETNKVINGEYLIGYEVSDAKKINS